MNRLYSSFPRRQVAVRLTAGLAGVTSVTAGGFFLWTRHCRFEPFEPHTDRLFQHPIFSLINPLDKPHTHDSCVRRVPFNQIQPSLLKDARHGGPALIEAYAQGVFGRYAYAFQRLLLGLLKDEVKEGDVWTKHELYTSTYKPDTCLNNFFLVLSKTPQSLIIRGCFSPRQDPPTPQTIDNIVELHVHLDESTKTAEFRFKTFTFDGTEAAPETEDPFGGMAGWVHRQYTKLLVEAGVGNCTRE